MSALCVGRLNEFGASVVPAKATAPVAQPRKARRNERDVVARANLILLNNILAGFDGIRLVRKG